MLAAALAVGAISVVGALGTEVNNDLVGPFFAMLFVAYSIGAHAEGRTLIAATAVLLAGCVVGVLVSDPPGGADDRRRRPHRWSASGPRLRGRRAPPAGT